MSILQKLTQQFYWPNMLSAVKAGFMRFPAPFIAALCSTLISILIVHTSGDDDFYRHLRVFFIYAGIALTAIKLFIESARLSALVHTLLATLAVVLIGLFIMDIKGLDIFMLIIGPMSKLDAFVLTMLFLSIAGSLLFAPYCLRKASPASVWFFNYKTGAAVFFAIFVALILGSGLWIILVSIGYLFEVDISRQFYNDIWVLSWYLVFPLYILTHIARDFEFDDQAHCAFPAGIRFIVHYLLVPMMLVYAGILYAYFARILVQWTLPRGNLGWMISGFGTLGVITTLLAYPIHDKGTRLLYYFNRYYYPVLALPTAVLIMAAGIRIHEYGVTESRYALVLLAICFALLICLAVFANKRFHIKHVPMVFSGLALLALIGPWSAVTVSTNSQVSRFKNLLEKHQLLVNGQAVRATQTLPFDDLTTISSIADYLTANKQRFAKVAPWFKTLQSDSNAPKIRFNGYGLQLTRLLALGYVHAPYDRDNDGRFVLRSRNDDDEVDGLLAVSGYDFISESPIYSGNGDDPEKLTFTPAKKRETVATGLSDNTLTVHFADSGEVTFDLDFFLQYMTAGATVNLNQEAFSLTKTSNDGALTVRLLFSTIKGRASTDDKVEITGARYHLMFGLNDQ